MMIDSVLFGLSAVWVMIWGIILVNMIVRKIGSNVPLAPDQILPKPHPLLYRIQRYILWIFAITFALRVLAGAMGWAPPFPGEE